MLDGHYKEFDYHTGRLPVRTQKLPKSQCPVPICRHHMKMSSTCNSFSWVEWYSLPSDSERASGEWGVSLVRSAKFSHFVARTVQRTNHFKARDQEAGRSLLNVSDFVLISEETYIKTSHALLTSQTYLSLCKWLNRILLYNLWRIWLK